MHEIDKIHKGNQWTFLPKGLKTGDKQNLWRLQQLTLNTANQPPKVPWFSVSLKTCAVIIDF